MERKELTRFYFDTMALNDQLMQWYRAFFLAFEGAILGGVLTIHDSNSFSPWWSFILVVVGLALSFLAVWACVQRGNIVDRQKKKIQKELFDEKGDKKDPNDSLADCFEIYSRKRKAEKYVPRYTFNIILHVIIGGLLAYNLWQWKPIHPDWEILYIGIIAAYGVLVSLAWAYFSHFGVPEDLWEKRWFVFRTI